MTAHTVEQIAADILAREGGFVNDPSDPGGATNYGVTIGEIRALHIDMNGDGKIDITDVKDMTPDKAREIFIDYYFRAPHIDQLPEDLWAPVFDMQVNSGNNAVKILQRMCPGIAADGAIGPVTVAAVQKAGITADAYSVARREWYYSVADNRPASRKYCRTPNGGKGGWIVRAEAFMSPGLWFSAAQHNARCAKWL